MKKLLSLLLFISCSVVGFGQQDSMFTIEGTVTDEITGVTLQNAHVFLIKNGNNIDSIDTDKNGFYKFEIADTCCYGLIVRKIESNYFSLSTDKPYCFYESQNARHDFWLNQFITDEESRKFNEKYIIFPLVDTFKLQIFVKDENDKIIENTQLRTFYENGEPIIYAVKNGKITIDYIRRKKLYLEVTKEGFTSSQQTYYFSPVEGCIVSDPIREGDYDIIKGSGFNVDEFQKIHFTLKKE